MDGGEDKEENNAGENEEEAPAADDQQTDPPKEPTPEPPKEPTPEPPKEPTPDPTPKSPTPAPDISSPKSTTPAPEPPTVKSPSPQKTPSRSIVSVTPTKTPSRSITTVTVTSTTTPSLSKSVEDKVASKSTVRLSEKIDGSQDHISEKNIILQNSGALRSGASGGGGGCGAPVAAFPASLGEYGTGGILKKRSPFIHDPPQPEERRARFPNPRTPREYIINLREDLADFQETHGLPRTRDYSFLSLGLALAQETARAIYSVLLMFAELFPILAIVSLILRFALDKLIEILETTEPVPKLKKSVIFIVEMIVIVIPLWILIGSIVIPLVSLIFSMFTRMLRLKKGRL